MIYPQKDSANFKDYDFYGEVMGLLFAGTDTISSTLASCLLLLAYHQDVQEKLFQEISSVLGRDDDVTTQDLLLMPYLDQVFRETLRWACVVPILLRKAKEDICLSSCTVPAGNVIVVSLAGLNMDPKTFKNPQQFDPDRFSTENRMDNNIHDFLPFSGGPRDCIGKLYANMLVKIMIIHVVHSFKLSTTMDVQTMKKKMTIFLLSAEGYNISFERRRGESEDSRK